MEKTHFEHFGLVILLGLATAAIILGLLVLAVNPDGAAAPISTVGTE